MARQLNLQEREMISQGCYAGEAPAVIARRLGRHRGTIGRELKRNSTCEGYCAVYAQHLAEQRRSERPLVRKMERPKVQEYVKKGLKKYWSPEQIGGRSQRDFFRRCDRVSHQTIYAWIKGDDHRRRWERFLRFGGRRRTRPDRRGKIPGAVRMDHRPEVVDRRNRYGDWEGDTIVGRRHRGTILTQVERKSGYLLASKLSRRSSKNVRCASLWRLGRLPAKLRKTMTFDNGQEFRDPDRWADQLQMEVYFTRPGCPWQRGVNENTNGLLRQFFPKGTDLRQVTRWQLRQAEDLINNRPRKRLGYRTPREMLAKYLDVALEN